jgi:hypothetical protein
VGLHVLVFGSEFYMVLPFYLMDCHHGHGEIPYVFSLEDNPFAECIIIIRTATTIYVVHLPEKVIHLRKKRIIQFINYKLQKSTWLTEPKVYKYLDFTSRYDI